MKKDYLEIFEYGLNIMNRGIFLIILNVFISLHGYSQLLVSGKVLGLPGRRPISFVNIGIVNSSVGTISDEDGSFLLKIPNYYGDDTVIFSALGYGNIKIPVAGLSEEANYMIYLKESPTNLKTVTIKGDSWKRRIYRIGNRSVRGSIMVADTVTAGSAIALLIKNDP
ncbi:MAG TPA: carboxypeptidase-like regulatory domain-containing protein, partial [Cyclobacteriaceae bacterium]|nr:carboxypeptidase-like regulatory domain-containing protein [Cyclobacteriaceae bacterium]